MKKTPSIKILVGYHKPAVLFKNDILTPIHLGRALATEASKDGAMSLKDYQWMLDNMIGDDTGDNISNLNRNFAELTGIYWAWKNYDKLENPDYIGFCHYRRLFDNHVLKEFLNNRQDILALRDCTYGETIKTQFEKYHGNQLNQTLKNLSVSSPEYSLLIDEYLQQDWGFMCNMFVMKKDIFFAYCQWIFPQLFTIHEKYDYSHDIAYNLRMPAFLAERLSGIYIQKQNQLGKTVKDTYTVFQENTLPKSSITPSQQAITVCLAADDNYAKYLGVTLQSFVCHISSEKHYEIYILDGGISEYNKKKLHSICDKKNISLKFVWAMDYIPDINKFLKLLQKQPSKGRINITTYFRLFIPEIFKNFNKVLYLDSDIIICEDVAELYNTELKNNLIGAALDTGIQYTYRYNSSFVKYSAEVLQLKNYHNYFNAGITLFNVHQMRKEKLLNKFMQLIKKADFLMFDDQDVLNSVCQDKVCYFDYAWNYEAQLDNNETCNRWMSLKHYKTHFNCKKPKILHYIFVDKPWKCPENPHAETWWHYARMTPFYEEILFKNLNSRNRNANNAIDLTLVRETANYLKNKITYWRYRLLSKITFGKKRRKYKQKRKELKTRLKQVRAFLKGK